MPNFFSLDPEKLNEIIVEMGEKPFRTKQIFNWVYNNQITDPENMNTLAKDFRQRLKKEISFHLPKILQIQTAADGTKKFLLKLQDDNLIEMVLIITGKHNTLCVSSQVGCARNCRFCATAKMGLIRNLQVEEITAQVFLAKQQLGNDKLTNIVFMGMGEPLDNYTNVIKAFDLLQNQQIFSFSPRRITISTSGILPGIEKLAKSGKKVKLAVSLNSAIQEKREYLMPVSKKYSLTELKKKVIKFQKENPYRITFEYVLIKNFNMGKEDIRALRAFVGDISCKLNLIPWNTVSYSKFEAPEEKEIDELLSSLKDLRVTLTVRRSRGTEIESACGQLAADLKK